MDVFLTPLFLADFLSRLFTAPSRRGYFFAGLGWLDLLAVIPLLRILRTVRIIQVVRWLRASGRARIADELSESRASATFLLTIFLVFIVVEAAGATIYAAEIGDPSSNIRSAGDAIWWGLVMITTVGYGDRYPVTFEGRIIGVFLLFAGIALFSVLTGFIANVFLAPRRRRMLAPQADDSRTAISTLRTLLAEQDERTEQIRLQLDDLERTMARNADESGPDRPA